MFPCCDGSWTSGSQVAAISGHSVGQEGVVELKVDEEGGSPQTGGLAAPTHLSQQAPSEKAASASALGSHKENNSNSVANLLRRASSSLSGKSSVSDRSFRLVGQSERSGDGKTERSIAEKSQPSMHSLPEAQRSYHSNSAVHHRSVAIGESCTTVSPSELNSRHGGRPNLLRTTKFTWLTWIPKSLFFQFQRVANIYFLYIAAIVAYGDLIDSWSPKNWMSKIGPFAFVLLWTACKDLFEDVRRKRDDRAENTQKVVRLNHKTKDFEEAEWQDILVGDVVYVRADEAFPADMVLLHCAEENEAFISTVMLDGETSLKPRQAPLICEGLVARLSSDPEWPAADSGASKRKITREAESKLLKTFARHVAAVGVEINLGQASPVLSDVRGNITLAPAKTGDEVKENPLKEENFLPRGCILKSTAWVVAVCGYVGNDTKTRMNATASNLKFGKMQHTLNWCVRMLLISLFSLCFFATVMSQIVGEADWPVHVMFLRFCIVLYHAVPMSLYVVYEMLKLILGIQVNLDKQMVDPETNQGALARTADLMEDMGQIDFIFSDKTGTLTANEMVFAKCHCAGQDLGDFRGPQAAGKPTPGAATARKIQGGPDPAKAQQVSWFFTCLATCHTVQINEPTEQDASVDIDSSVVREVRPEGMPQYDGVSPDEVALVRAAHEAGVCFLERNRVPGTLRSELVLGLKSEGVQKRYEILAEIPFTSARKKMSVIITDKKKIWCVTKGADNIMEGLCTDPFTEECRQDIKRFSQEGLRVLVVGSREVSNSYFERWKSEYSKAFSILGSAKEKTIAALEAKMEDGLTFCGITALEDRLQDGVPEAIEVMKEAGARLWILTGDKTETCVNIARSCRLFNDSTKLAYAVENDTIEQARAALRSCQEQIQGVDDAGLVLDGRTMLAALEDLECRNLIFNLGLASKSCACTRLSPMQKLKIVQLVRAISPTTVTLAIGDGANDVPMIQGAHVGIGIRGKEGAQAVQACDVAISQFRFLVPLLMCHGRRAYRRVSLFLNYYLYKNIVLLMSDIIWMMFDSFRGRIAFPEYLSINFSVFFTSWHIFFVLGFDHDVPDAVACKTPELYWVGPKQQLFNLGLFSKWLAYATLHGCMAWLIPWALLDMTASLYPDEKGTESYFWVGSVTAFTCVDFIALLKLVIVAEQPFSWITLLPTFGSVACYFIGLAILGYGPIGASLQPEMNGVPGKVFGDSTALACCLLVPLAACSLDVADQVGSYFLCPTPLQQAYRSGTSSRAA